VQHIIESEVIINFVNFVDFLMLTSPKLREYANTSCSAIDFFHHYQLSNAQYAILIFLHVFGVASFHFCAFLYFVGSCRCSLDFIIRRILLIIRLFSSK